MHIIYLQTQSLMRKSVKLLSLWLTFGLGVLFNSHGNMMQNRSLNSHGNMMQNHLPAVKYNMPRNMEECINRSGYTFHKWTPNTNMTWRIMSMVQIEKSGPSGFASRCDWVIGSRSVTWGVVPRNTAWGIPNMLPRTIFLQTDELQKFNDRMLPCFSNFHRFSLVIGDHDKTTPKQVDSRFSSPTLQHSDWHRWLSDERILHLFVEHLDTVSPPDRVTAIPVGLNPEEFENYNPDSIFQYTPEQIDISAKPPRIVFTNRIRDFPQFRDRQLAHDMCTNLSNCDVMVNAPIAEFIPTIKDYAFLLCVHGGGIEPNPNVFTALLVGVIPIVAPFPGYRVYDGLPVVFTDGNWTESLYFSEEFLTSKLKELAPFFENASKRGTVLKKLLSQHWWNLVQSTLESVDKDI